MYKFLFIVFFTTGFSQSVDSSPNKEEIQAPQQVVIKPTARDSEISNRIESILGATGWFIDPRVEVKDGVVFLFGSTKKEEVKKWAGDLAQKTTDVSAVVNKIDIERVSPWDFGPTIEMLQKQLMGFFRVIPSLIFALVIFLLAWPFSKLTVRMMGNLLEDKITSTLLRDVLSRCIGILVFVFAFYIIFQVLGLTTIALTLLGSTGAIGIILGIAFKDITENLLASIFLSIHHPFRIGDLIEVANYKGYVQRLNVRSTVLLSVDGDHIQIPNATIYKSNIRNLTANPNHRIDFTLSVNPEHSISGLQEKLLKVLAEHPAILTDPDPWVLVENITNDSVVLHLYFWVNALELSPSKVKSSVLRGARRALREADGEKVSKKDPVFIDAEGRLSNESDELKSQAEQSRGPEKGDQNLLDS